MVDVNWKFVGRYVFVRQRSILPAMEARPLAEIKVRLDDAVYETEVYTVEILQNLISTKGSKLLV